MFNHVRKPVVTPGTSPRSLAKRVSLREINKAQPSDIYNNSCSPYLELWNGPRPFTRVPPLPVVLNLTCFAMQHLRSHINPAVLIYDWPSQMLSWHYKCRVIINLPQPPLTFWKLNTGALGGRNHENMIRHARFSYHRLLLLDLVLTRSAGSGSGSERAAQFSRR